MSLVTTFAIKVDVDTEVGTRVGVPNLLALFEELSIPATFYLSLGPDHTGRALKRIFRKGFVKKCTRTRVVSTYGLRTLLNGVLLPGPHIGKKHGALLRMIQARGFETGIHAYDHQKWQDGVATLAQLELEVEFQKALQEYLRIFETAALTAAAPGWQANAKTLEIYEQAKLVYASDCRGTTPFFPKIADRVYQTPQIPTTLPALDELLGCAEFPLEALVPHYLSLVQPEKLNVLTIHAELEGMRYLELLRSLLAQLQKQAVNFVSLGSVAATLTDLPVCLLEQAAVPGRSGILAYQGARI